MFQRYLALMAGDLPPRQFLSQLMWNGKCACVCHMHPLLGFQTHHPQVDLKCSMHMFSKTIYSSGIYQHTGVTVANSTGAEGLMCNGGCFCQAKCGPLADKQCGGMTSLEPEPVDVEYRGCHICHNMLSLLSETLHSFRG